MVCSSGPREDSQEQHLALWQLASQFFHNGCNPIGDLRGVIASHVVGADHHDDDFGTDAMEFLAVAQAPKNMLRLIAANPEVSRLQGSKALLPDFFSRAFPTLR